MTGEPHRIVLDEVRFRRLVAGQVVAAPAGQARVEIVLSDIGWHRILRAIVDAMAQPGAIGDSRGPPDPPQAREFLPLPRRTKGWGSR